MDTNASLRPDVTDDDELWFPAGITSLDLAFIPVDGKSLGVDYGGANGLILDGFFNTSDQQIGKFVFSMPNGQAVKMGAWDLVNSSGVAG